MDIRIFQKGDRLLIELTGRVVLDECDRLKSSIVPHIVPGVKQVNLDLSRVDFIDSAGLGALVTLKVSTNKTRAALALLSPSKGVNDILLVSKLDSIFDIVTGPDAKRAQDELARPEFLKSAEAQQGNSAPSSAPSFQAPPSSSATAAAGSSKERIALLCKNAVEFMRTRDYEAAVDCYVKVLEIDPEYLPAHNNLAIVYEKKPEWQDKAVAQWERVMEMANARGDMKHVERAQKHLQTIQRL